MYLEKRGVNDVVLKIVKVCCDGLVMFYEINISNMRTPREHSRRVFSDQIHVRLRTRLILVYNKIIME